MAISNKTRKLLWGRSGNLCAICKCELVMSSTELNNSVIIGDECHIIAKNPGGPRWDSTILEEYFDGYQNLILLCKIHHKVIDDQPLSFPVTGLKKLKTNHEDWVKTNLQKDRNKRHKEKFQTAPRIIKGKDIVSIVADAHFYDYDYDEPEKKEELELISMFLQYAQDIGDLGDDMEARDQVQIGFEMTTQIRELEKLDYWVFGIREQRKYKFSDQISLWDVAVLRILKKTNRLIKSDQTLSA